MTDPAQPANAPTANGADQSENASHWFSGFLARIGLTDSPTLRDILEEALKRDDEQAASFTAPEREMLLRILRFGGLRVEDIMVPRADITAIDEQAAITELLDIFQSAGHSRIPLYRDTLDDLKGMVHIKDLLAWITDSAQTGKAARDAASVNGIVLEGGEPANSRQTATSAQKPATSGEAHRPVDLGSVDLNTKIVATRIKRPVLFVPPSMPAVNLFLRMQTTRIHLAMVIDEYGGTDGLVSIEDLVEQIVGDIEDEHDENGGPLIEEDSIRGLIASARLPIGELEAHLGLTLLAPEDEDDVDTLGGLVFSLVDRVPSRGELVPHPSGVEFEVLDADPRRIKLLKIHRKKSPRPSELRPQAEAAE